MHADRTRATWWPRSRANVRAGVVLALVMTVAMTGVAPGVGMVPTGASVRSVEVREGITWRTISGETLLLDLYLPEDDATSRPAVLLVHGGGWRGGDRSDLAPGG